MWVTVVWLGQFVGPLTKEQYLSLVHELIFWNPFPIGGYLAQPRYREEDVRNTFDYDAPSVEQEKHTQQ